MPRGWSLFPPEAVFVWLQGLPAKEEDVDLVKDHQGAGEAAATGRGATAECLEAGVNRTQRQVKQSPESEGYPLGQEELQQASLRIFLPLQQTSPPLHRPPRQIPTQTQSSQAEARLISGGILQEGERDQGEEREGVAA
jgi:hypothetical protein